MAVLVLVWFIQPFGTTRIEYVERNPPAVTDLQDAETPPSAPPVSAVEDHDSRVSAAQDHDSRVSVASDVTGITELPSNRAIKGADDIAADAAAVAITHPSDAGENTPERTADIDRPSGNGEPSRDDAMASEFAAATLDPSPPAVIDAGSPPSRPAVRDIQTAAPSAIVDIPEFPVADGPDISAQAFRGDLTWNATSNGFPDRGSDSHGLPEFLSHFIFEMRVMNGKSNPQVNLPYSSANLFKDIAFSLSYKIDDRNAIGIEYGRETFGQEYSSYEMETDPLVDIVIKSPNEVTAPWMPKTYTRNMLLDWFGASWKVSFKQFEMLSMIYPYVRTLVGTTKQGPIGKMRIGLEIAPTKYTMFNIGFEGSFLRYEVDKMWNRTTKFGITAGLVAGF